MGGKQSTAKPAAQKEPVPKPDFTITLEKPDAADSWGMSLTYLSGTFLTVRTVKTGGVVANWNVTKAEAGSLEACINEQDIITSINDVTGDATKMMDQMKETRVILSVKRAAASPPSSIAISLRIDRAEDEKLGMSLEHANGELKVIAVKDDGAVPKFNAAGAEQIRADNIIAAVNGAYGNTAAMMEQLKQTSVLLSFKGPPEAAPRVEEPRKDEPAQEEPPKEEVVEVVVEEAKAVEEPPAEEEQKGLNGTEEMKVEEEDNKAFVHQVELLETQVETDQAKKPGFWCCA